MIYAIIMVIMVMMISVIILFHKQNKASFLGDYGFRESHGDSDKVNCELSKITILHKSEGEKDGVKAFSCQRIGSLPGGQIPAFLLISCIKEEVFPLVFFSVEHERVYGTRIKEKLHKSDNLNGFYSDRDVISNDMIKSILEVTERHPEVSIEIAGDKVIVLSDKGMMRSLRDCFDDALCAMQEAKEYFVRRQ